MRISQPRISSGRYNIKVGSKELWFSVDPQFSNFLSETADAALVGLLVPAMLDGTDIHIDAPTSERLLYHLNGRHQDAIRMLLPQCRRVSVSATSVHTMTSSGGGVATGFSGGIDSFSAVANHFWKGCQKGHRLTHLLHNNVGAHGSEEKFKFSAEQAKRTAFSIDLPPIVVVDSNIADFYDDRLTFQQTHAHRNTAAALALQGGIRRFYYASTYRYADIRLQPTHDIAFADPILLPQLSTDALDVVAVGSEYSRVQKTLELSMFPQTFKALDVCTSGLVANKNCSTCFKCLRTMLTLDLAGRLDRYSSVFYLEKYQSRKEWYMARVLSADDPFSRELADFIREKRHPISIKTRLFDARNKLARLAL